MRPRAKRDLSILFVVVVVLGAGAFVNYNMRRGDLAEKMVKWRQEVEEEREGRGLELLDWSLVQKTKGTYWSGPTFHDELLPKNGQRIDIVGFMVPLEEFRQVTTFLLLPMPLECYFCQRPPMRDIVLVTLDESERKVDIYNEPVVINGDLRLNEGPKQKYFYTLEHAKMGPGEIDGTLTKRHIPEEHRIPKHEPTSTDLEKGYDPKIGQHKDLVVEP